MAKMTVLQMVQDILSDLNSDEITTLSDTVEAGQVEKVLKQVFFQMCSNQIIPEHEELTRLSTVVLGTHAGALNYLSIPTTVQEILWFKYNRRLLSDVDDNYGDLIYLDPKSFTDLVSTNRSSDTACTQVTDPTSSVTYYVRHDTPPSHWTSFDDTYIALDSFDITVDTAQVLGTKSLAYASLVPSWTDDTDGFIPAIDDNLFPFLVAEAKSTCFLNMNQTPNPKIEKQAKDQRIAIQQRKFKTWSSEEGSINSTKGPSYGRRSPR